MEKQKAPPFTQYQKYIILILAITQFTVILDFMVMSPLGDMLMKSLSIKPSQFGIAVSAYALSAGGSGLLTAGFADRFDRKKILLFFYAGFILGTFFCGLANTYPLLVAARIITGLFGGVIGAVTMAIVTDLFELQQRGRVMGFVQMGLGASQVLGVPIGIFLANSWGWQSPFLMIAGLSIMIFVLVLIKLKPVADHLSSQEAKTAFSHLFHTLTKKEYRVGFSATALLTLGGFMMMPFGSAFAINNLHITQQQLPYLFMVGGVGTLLIMPQIGKLSDKIDKFLLFAVASFWMIGIVLIYTNLTAAPLWLAMIFNILMMMGIMGRMIPSGALTSAIPEPKDRGAFMSINSSLSQIAGGLAAAFAGMIVVQKTKTSPLEHYNTLGIVISCITIVCIYMVYRVNIMVKNAHRKKTEDAKVFEQENLFLQESVE